MNLSDEAVEAAAKATYSSDGLNAWALEDVSTHNHYRRKARILLEAAAPHLMAQAWEEGHERGFWNGRLSQLTVPSDAPDPLIGKQDAEAANPYRSAGAGE